MKFFEVLLVLGVLAWTLDGSSVSRYASRMVQQRKIDSTRPGGGLNKALGDTNAMYKLLTDALKQVNPDIKLQPPQRAVYTKNPPENEDKPDKHDEVPSEDAPDPHPQIASEVPASSPAIPQDALRQGPETQSTIYEAIFIPKQVDKGVYDDLLQSLRKPGWAPGLECSPTDRRSLSVERAARDSHEEEEDTLQERPNDHSHKGGRSDDHSKKAVDQNHDASEDLADFSEGTKHLELIVNEEELSEKIIELLKELSVHPTRAVRDE